MAKKKSRKVSPINKRLAKHLRTHRSMVSSFPIDMNPLERVEQMGQVAQSSGSNNNGNNNY